MIVGKERLIEQAYEEINKHKECVESDEYRLLYHIMPPVGLLNDPNGFIQWKGTYHLFYQWMPFKTEHGAKFWGHYSSPNLVHWQAEPIALAPTDWFDKNGCYSGSAIADGESLKLFYTGNVKDAVGNRETYQCLAESKDGIQFEKKGVVVELPEGYTAHFRDPKVWKHEDHFYMIIGAQSLAKQGQAVLFRSTDLKDWTHLGAIAGGGTEQLTDFGYMWECPDLFRLQEADILLVSPQGLEPEGMLYQNVYQSGYFVGQLDYEQAHYAHGGFTELDRGFEFYAPQTTLDEQGRRIMIAWMGVPEQYEQEHPTVKHRWVHTLTLPRELQVVQGKLYQKPVAELQQLRKEEKFYPQVTLDGQDWLLDNVGEATELKIDLSENKAVDIALHIRDYATFRYHSETKTATLERKSFVDHGIEIRQCYLENITSLHLFLDTSSLEIFLNDGEEVFTARIFPEKGQKQLVLHSTGKLVCDVWQWLLK